MICTKVGFGKQTVLSFGPSSLTLQLRRVQFILPVAVLNLNHLEPAVFLKAEQFCGKKSMCIVNAGEAGMAAQ